MSEDIEQDWSPVAIEKAREMGYVDITPLSLTRRGRWWWHKLKRVEKLAFLWPKKKIKRKRI